MPPDVYSTLTRISSCLLAKTRLSEFGISTSALRSSLSSERMTDSGSLRLIQKSTYLLLVMTMESWSSSSSGNDPPLLSTRISFSSSQRTSKFGHMTSRRTSSPILLSLKKFGSPWVPPRTLSYNPAERSILVTSPADNGTYELDSPTPRWRWLPSILQISSVVKAIQLSLLLATDLLSSTHHSQQVDIKDLEQLNHEVI